MQCDDRRIWFPAFFSYFFSQYFVYSVAFWCHPSNCYEDKGIKWRLLYFNHSLVVFLFLLLFMLLVDLCQGLPRIRLWGRMCDPYVKESFLTAIPQSSRRDIQPCIVSSLDFSLIVIFIDWQKCGFGLNIPLSLSVPKSLSVSCASLKCSHLVCIWGCDPQSLSLHKHSEWVCLSPSIDLMQIASVNSCLFSAYPIALIGKADSQEDAPFSIVPFVSCCDSGVISAKSSSRMFLHFSYLSYRILFFVRLVNCWSKGL